MTGTPGLTVLREKKRIHQPFALKGTKTFFQEQDPLFLAAAERAILHSSNASVHGSMWETCMPPVFVETFRNRPLSSWPLLTSNTLPNSLVGDVTIVGYHEQEPKLAISHKSITTHDFMKAHVENDSKRGYQAVPPYSILLPSASCFRTRHCILHQDQWQHVPCFSQLKLRQVLEGSDVEKALTTISSGIIQSKMGKEHEKVPKEQAQEDKKTNRKQSTKGTSAPPRL